MKSDFHREAGAGNVWLALRLAQCLSQDADAAAAAEIYATYSTEFSAVTRSGNEYPGKGTGWSDWPTPKFPEVKSMIPGRCVKGWIAFEVPEGLRFESILWRPGGQTAAEWLPKA